MAYSEAQRALAIGLVQQNNGRLDAATLNAIRLALNAPTLSKQLVHYWLHAEQQPKTVKESKSNKADILTESPGGMPAAEETSLLTGKQRAFAEAYTINGFNATEAARTAQYSGDDHALAVIGSRNLRNAEIRTEIERLLAERVMGPKEVLARLADHATANLGDFFAHDDLPESMRNSDKLHLLKKIKITNKEYAGIKTQQIELELHDPQAALVQLGRHYKLFTDRTEIDMPPELAKMMLELFGSAEKASEAFKRLMEEKARAEAATGDNGDV